MSYSPLLADEKAVPAIIVTPSSPMSAQDYSIHFLPLPPKPARRPWLAVLAPFSFRFRRSAPIQLPTSAHDTTSFPIDSLPSSAGHVNKARARRNYNRVLVLLAIPLLIVLIHILVALAFDDASFPAARGPAVLFDAVSRVFGSHSDTSNSSHDVPGANIASSVPELD